MSHNTGIQMARKLPEDWHFFNRAGMEVVRNNSDLLEQVQCFRIYNHVGLAKITFLSGYEREYRYIHEEKWRELYKNPLSGHLECMELRNNKQVALMGYYAIVPHYRSGLGKTGDPDVTDGSKEFELISMAVYPEYRRFHFGTMLLYRAMKAAEHHPLFVRVLREDKSTLRFFGRFSFFKQKKIKIYSTVCHETGDSGKTVSREEDRDAVLFRVNNPYKYL